MPTNNNLYPRASNSDLVCREVDENMLILDSNNEQVHELNVTATYIWKLCDGQTSVESIARSFAEIFGIPIEKAFEDVESVISALLEKSLLTLGQHSSVDF